MNLVEGSQSPSFVLTTTDGEVRVPDPNGRPMLVMFFQEAGTPLCTAQLTSLAVEHELLAAMGAHAVCVSTDDSAVLSAFAATLPEGQPSLASDVDGAVARAFGVYDETSKRAHRAAFVIDGAGVVRLAIPWYNPSNSSQFAATFEALGVQDSE